MKLSKFISNMACLLKPSHTHTQILKVSLSYRNEVTWQRCDGGFAQSLRLGCEVNKQVGISRVFLWMRQQSPCRAGVYGMLKSLECSEAVNAQHKLKFAANHQKWRRSFICEIFWDVKHYTFESKSNICVIVQQYIKTQNSNERHIGSRPCSFQREIQGSRFR